MKSFLLTFILIASLQAFEYGLKPVKVSQEIYCFFGAAEAMDTHNNGNMVNSCFVDMGTSWIAIDSGPSYLYAKEAYHTIQSIKRQKIAFVFNTHVHDDHWLGNGFYKQLGATIVGSSYFKEAVNPNAPTRMQNRISKEAYKGTTITLPDEFISKSIDLTIDKHLVELIHLTGTAHTKGDVLIYLPHLKALFAGDLIFNDRLPSLRDGDINFWILTLKKLQAMPLKILIGGHGKRSDKDSLLLTLRYLQDLKSAVIKALDEGLDLEEALEHIDLKAYSKVGMYQSLNRQNIQTAFQQLEWSHE